MRKRALSLEELEELKIQEEHERRFRETMPVKEEKSEPEKIRFSEDDLEWAESRLSGPKSTEFRMLAYNPEELCYLRDYGTPEERAEIQFLEHEEERILSHEQWDMDREASREFLDKMVYWSLDD